MSDQTSSKFHQIPDALSNKTGQNYFIIIVLIRLSPRAAVSKLYGKRMRRRLSTDRLFHVFSARRSGQHAILGWLMAQMRQPLARLNMCNVPHAIGPYGLKVLGKSARQHLRGLFMNYEDHAPIELERCNGLAGLVEGVDAQQVTPILILRDPFNHLASKRAANPERDIDFGRQEAELWKTYAREYLGETKFIPDKVCINFNEWFSDAAYREQLSNRLNLDYPASSPQAVAAMQAIPPVGCSQFDGRRFDGNAQQMDVLDRWRQRFDDPVYVALLQDEELLALSARIFVMPEVDEWLTKQRTLLAS